MQLAITEGCDTSASRAKVHSAQGKTRAKFHSAQGKIGVIEALLRYKEGGAMALDKATGALLIGKAPTGEVIAFGERTGTVARVGGAEEMSLSAKTMGLIRKIVLDNFGTDH